MKSFAAWLTPRRLRAQALVLALCLWGVCAFDFATPGTLDRDGNIKFQDFLPVYAAARLISQGRAAEIYDEQLMAGEMRSVIEGPTGRSVDQRVRLPYLYGPQVALLFVPLARMSFLSVAGIWAAASLAIYVGCIFLIVKSGAPFLTPFARSVALDESRTWFLVLAAIAYPPLFHCFVRGQNSVVVMACFVAAYFAFRSHYDWLAGIALGLLIFKPQFLVAIPVILCLSFAWRAAAGLLLSAAAQLAFAYAYFGPRVMRAYVAMLRSASQWLNSAELGQAPIQMHSLRAFWSMLIPWPHAAFAVYLVTSLAVIALGISIWKSAAPFALRFSALTLAAVLVNPHLFVYDLLALAPVYLLLADWIISRRDPAEVEPANLHAIIVCSYLAFLLPLFGPLSRWTHIQLSVPVFFALLWTLWRTSKSTTSHELASAESRVV